MSDSDRGQPPLPPKPAGDPAAPSVASLDLDNLHPGARWRGRFEIKEVLPDITYGKVSRATVMGNGEEVLVRSFRVTDDTRRHVWDRLAQGSLPGVVRLVEAMEVDGRRIEVVQSLKGTTLADWSGGRKRSLAELKPLIRQLAEIVGGLHERGVAHLNLRPQVVFVEGEGASVRLIVAGLEGAADFTRGGLVSSNVNPFYAPPEVVGLFQHHCSPPLRAWDWWSVGRIAQELVLGQHVLGLALGRDVSRQTPELLMRADQFLRESQGASSRAGGVELMPAMEPELTALLRGLLSSCRDARWGRLDLAAWLKGEPVKERYHLAQNERLFVWKDRAYAVSEAAEFFVSAAGWPDAVENIFGAENPQTLVHFLSLDGTYRALRERVSDLVRLADSSSFADIPKEEARRALAAIAMAVIAGGTVPLSIGGQKVDVGFLRALLAPSAPGGGLSLIEALTQGGSLQHIHHVDAEAGRLLQELSRVAESALTLGAQHHWVSRADRRAVAHLWLLSLGSAADWDPKIAEARTRFAVSRDEALNELFRKADLSPAEKVLLVYVLENADQHKFVTQQAWVEERYRALSAQAETAARLCTWLNLGRAQRMASHLMGPWLLVLVYWLLLAASLALAFPSRITLAGALAILLGGLASRMVLRIAMRGVLQRRLPDYTSRRLPSPSQCTKEATLLHKSSLLPKARALVREVDDVNDQIRALRSDEPLPAVAHPALFVSSRTLSLVSVLVAMAVLGTLGRRVLEHPPTADELMMAWLHPQPEAASENKNAQKEPIAAEPANEPEPSEESDGEEVKIAWPHRPSGSMKKIRVQETLEATSDQTRAAREVGGRATSGFKRDTIDQLVAVRVPVSNGIGLMLFDGKGDKLADRRVFVVGYEPLARTWLLLDDRLAIYLTAP